jgi:hypothetical protein
MDPIQMYRRCPSAKVIGVAKLPNHRLAFPVWSQSRQCAVASAIPADGEDLWGVVYEITDADEKVLGSHEGPKYDLREIRCLMTADGTEIESDVQLFVANTQDDLKGNNCKPNAAYMNHFMNGAKHHPLPQDYLEKLKRIEISG